MTERLNMQSLGKVGLNNCVSYEKYLDVTLAGNMLLQEWTILSKSNLDYSIEVF
jgi:hypothetical protein